VEPIIIATTAAANVNYSPVLSSEKAPRINKPATV
jgi:hypothetical protein